MHPIPDVLTSTSFSLGDQRAEGLKGTEGPPQHYDLFPLTRQRTAYLAALSSRSPALVSCPFLNCHTFKKKKKVVTLVQLMA